jgi:hypothetical protein
VPTIAVTLLAVAVAAVAGLARAGDDGSPTGRDGYVEALAAIGEAHGVQVDNGRCFAGATVDALGLDALREVATPAELRDGAGRTPRAWGISFDEAQSVAFYDRLQDCIDTRQVYLDRLRERGVTDEGMACVEEFLGNDLLRRFYVILWLDLEDPIDTDADLARDFRAALGHCPLLGT